METKKDRYTRSISPDSPARAAAEVTVSDTADLEFVTTALWVGTAGDVKVSMVDGGDVILVGVPAGTLLPIRVTRVWATGTHVSPSIVALW